MNQIYSSISPLAGHSKLTSARSHRRHKVVNRSREFKGTGEQIDKHFSPNKSGNLSNNRTLHNYNNTIDYPPMRQQKQHITNTSTDRGLFEVAEHKVKQSTHKLLKLKSSPNQLLKEMVFNDFITQLSISNKIFNHLDTHLVSTLVLMGKIEVFQHRDNIPQGLDHLCIVLYGRIKLSSKDFKIIVGQGQLLGQHSIFGLNIDAEIIALEESCLLILPIPFFKQLRKESIVNGLKQQFGKLQSLIRINYVSKNFPLKMSDKLK